MELSSCYNLIYLPTPCCQLCKWGIHWLSFWQCDFGLCWVLKISQLHTKLLQFLLYVCVRVSTQIRAGFTASFPSCTTCPETIATQCAKICTVKSVIFAWNLFSCIFTVGLKLQKLKPRIFLSPRTIRTRTWNATRVWKQLLYPSLLLSIRFHFPSAVNFYRSYFHTNGASASLACSRGGGVKHFAWN